MMKPGERLQSLDALRGFDMFFIMGLAALITNICNLFPGGGDCWLATQMTHVAWEGFRHHDTIFPLFLFLAGVSFPFSYAKQLAAGATRCRIYRKILTRGLVLVMLGFVYSGLLKFDFGHLRFFTVLTRISLAWMFAALIFINTKPAARAIICAVILVGYSLLLTIPAPDYAGTDTLSLEGNIVSYVDRTLFGPNHLYRELYDPEGLLGTLPAIVTALLGMFAGELVKLPEEKVSVKRKALYLVYGGAALLVLGFFSNIFQPSIKALWNTTFVLFAGAYSALMFALFYYIIDVKGWRKWTLPFVVVGMNSITIYFAQRLISFSTTNKFLLSGVVGLVSEPWGKVIYSLGYVTLCWLFLYFLYKKKVFLKV